MAGDTSVIQYRRTVDIAVDISANVAIKEVRLYMVCSKKKACKSSVMSIIDFCRLSMPLVPAMIPVVGGQSHVGYTFLSGSVLFEA